MTNEQVTVSRELLRDVLNNLHGANLCSVNSMSSRHEARRLIDNSITALRTALEQPAVEPLRSTAISECLQVLRPTVKGKFPQEQALDELAGYLAAPQAQEKP